MLLIFLFALIYAQPYIREYLCITKKVGANLLLVEGWVSDKTIAAVYEEFISGDYDLIVTTGLAAPDFYMVPMNGFLVFYTDSIFRDENKTGLHSIEALLYSETGGQHKSHFNFYINDLLINDFYVGKRTKSYGIEWRGALSEIDSIMIHFDNDAMGDFGDRNLFVKKLIINDTLHISYKNNALYNRVPQGWEKRIPLNYSTFAGIARNKLLELGMQGDKIITVPGERHTPHRTISAALSFHEWLASTNQTIHGINVITEGCHARRTWMAYNQMITGTAYELGVISVPQDNQERGFLFDTFRNYPEFFSTLYYWIALRMFYTNHPSFTSGLSKLMLY